MRFSNKKLYKMTPNPIPGWECVMYIKTNKNGHKTFWSCTQGTFLTLTRKHLSYLRFEEIE